MCCRYVLDITEKDLAEIVESAGQSPLLQRYRQRGAGELIRSGEVRPMNIAPAIASDRKEAAAVFPMRWGYQMEGRSTLLINARVETAAEKPSFRDSWLHHRCILPASRYFEWQHTPGEDGKTTTTKYAIQPYDTHITWLCGLYRIENGLPVYVVLTSEPSADVAHIHDRMPLILPKRAVRDWVNPKVRAEDLLPYALTRLEARPER